MAKPTLIEEMEYILDCTERDYEELHDEVIRVRNADMRRHRDDLESVIDLLTQYRATLKPELEKTNDILKRIGQDGMGVALLLRLDEVIESIQKRQSNVPLVNEVRMRGLPVEIRDDYVKKRLGSHRKSFKTILTELKRKK